MPKTKIQRKRKTKVRRKRQAVPHVRSIVVVHRIIIIGLACLMLFVSVHVAPSGSLARLDTSERNGVAETLQSAIGSASATYRFSAGLRLRQRAGERVAAVMEKEIQKLAREKREVRLQIAALQELIATLQSEYHIDVSTSSGAKALVERERDHIVSYVRYLQVRRTVVEDTGPRIARDFLRTSFQGSMGETVEEKLREDALQLARTRLFSFLMSVQELPDELTRLRARHAELIDAHLSALNEFDDAKSMATVSAAQLEEIKRTMAEVHDEVLNLQGELARIDARLARRAERALIEKGLRDARPGEHSDGTGPQVKQLFTWPVFGPISAGFHNSAYEKYFGVPHYGIDIVTGQGTAVRSAADGVVFLVRDGGEKGYTYILIGHRNGHATLYGHLFETSVTAGQDVSVGDVIGLSGGEPGTHGAGPMTTGAHVHFEVIVNATNVDPRTVLP